MISFEYIRKILAEPFKISEARIMPESRLGDDLGMDSLDVVEIIMTIEEEYDVEVPDEDAHASDFSLENMKQMTVQE